VERSTYVLFSSVALLLVFVKWRPIGGVVWSIDHVAGQVMLYALFVAGWAIVLTASFLINHFDLFGLRQTWLYFLGRPYIRPDFKTPLPYRLVRHPLYVGWLLVFWATPVMTAAHLVFAATLTTYILVAIRWEERDLTAMHPEYAAYRRRVPMLIPRWTRPTAGAESRRDPAVAASSTSLSASQAS
jgi:protein-S-isoprenylcysteine O-methyltransferase Ste14